MIAIILHLSFLQVFPPPPTPEEAGKDRIYLDIRFHLYQTGDLNDHNPLSFQHGSQAEHHLHETITQNKEIFKILDPAIKRAQSILNIEEIQYKGALRWFVVVDGALDRALLYPGRLWSNGMQQFGFTIVFNSSEEYLNINDFQIIQDGEKILHTSIGVKKDGATVLGSLEKGHSQTLIVVTFQSSKEPFPGQSTQARFQVDHLQ